MSSYERGVGYRWLAEWRAAEAIAEEEREARQGDAAARNLSSREVSMFEETARSGMLYGTTRHTATRDSGEDCQCLECEATAYLEAFPEPEPATAPDEPVADSQWPYDGRMAAESWAVLNPVTYGLADSLEASWESLGAGVSAGDAVRAGMRLYDPANVGRRSGWTGEGMRPGRPYASHWEQIGNTARLVWEVTPCNVYAADGTLIRTIVETLDTLGRRAGTNGGRKATSSADKRRNDIRSRVAAYRERKRAAREAANVGATPIE